MAGLLASDGRADRLATVAIGLAVATGIDLPHDLALLQTGRPQPSGAGGDRAAVDDPGGALGDALEGLLSDGERQRGAHYTPAGLADRVAAMALDGTAGRAVVVDPACGGGALLLAAGRRLVAVGASPAVVARELLWGADLDPLAVAVTETAIALWSGGTPPAPGHVVVGDTLRHGRDVWPDLPAQGFDAVVGNPPFQGQLARKTARQPGDPELRARFGDHGPYVDTAALFLLAAVDLARRGARVALVQPQSTVASRDAGEVRRLLSERARLVELWAPGERAFAARVNVCVPALVVGEEDPGRSWTDHLATARGVPSVELPTTEGTIGDRAEVVAGFRDEYYALVPHVSEAPTGDPAAPLVTSGLIDVGRCTWGEREARFAKRRWSRPAIDVAAVAAADARMAGWLDRVTRPKLVVATQTRVLEAAPDPTGRLVPCTPVISVVPEDRTDLDRLAAALCAPPVSAWAARRAAGSALSPDAIRVSAPLVAAVPLPEDEDRWLAAAVSLVHRDLHSFAEHATAMYGLVGPEAREVAGWWIAQARI